MSDRKVEPVEVARMVERYVSAQHRLVAEYSNVSLLDESGTFDLHTLAASVYALGFNDGQAAESVRQDGQRQRTRDAEARPDPTRQESK